MKARLICSLFLIIVVCSCADSGNPSPYEQLLLKEPYANLTDSIHRYPSEPGIYYRRGMLLYKNNNIPPALADFKKAWALDKKENYAVGISNALQVNDPDSNILFLKEALLLLPQSISLRVHLIQGYADLQRVDDALAVCNEVLQQHPNQVAVLMMKSDLLEEKNDPAGAVSSLELAYYLAPFNKDLCYNLAFKYAQTKNPRTLALCDSLIGSEVKEKDAEPYYFKGVYFANINNKTTALGMFDKSIEVNYTFLDAYMDKGQILYDEQKYSAAAAVFQLALKVSSTYADGYYWLGRCQEALGQKEDARLNYQRAYGLDKSLAEAKAAADKL